MPHDNDSSEIVKQFMELWQQQFAHTMRDPESLASTLALCTQMQENYAKSMQVFFNHETKQPSSNSSATGASSHDSTALMECHRRIAELEARVAHLESKLTATHRKADTEAA